MPKVSKMRATLTPEEFATAAARHPKLEKKALMIARAVLVDGEEMHVVADRERALRQNVHFWTKLIYNSAVPEGWVAQVITLPQAAMKKVLELQAEERAKWEARNQKN
jgi:hypothetical protein